MMLHSPIVAGGGAGPSPIRLRVLSLGAGVQSTTLALMAAHGHFGSLDCESSPIPAGSLPQSTSICAG